MKKQKIMITAAFLTMSLATTSLAGTWQPQTIVQWKYQNDDGSYQRGWVEDDGKYYYMGTDGIMLTDTRTPDGYYVGADGVWDGQPPATTVITAGETAPAVSHTTSTPSTVYQPGIYQVGVDIPAGEYVLLARPGSTEAEYEVRTDNNFSTYASYIDGTGFRYNMIVQLKNGQYISLENCTASPIGEVPRLDSSQAEMYKVGYHIPAGTYHLYALDYTYAGYAVLSAPTATDWDQVLTIDIVYSDTSVTVESGQYLYLFECILAEETDPSAADAARTRKAEAAEEEAAQPASRVVTAGVTERLSGITSTPTTVYPDGYYEVGKDIPAGEYVLLSTEEGNAYYEIRTNMDFDSYDDMVDYCNFSYNAIIRLEDGQFLRLSRCNASPIGEVPQISFMKGEMFKVGYHIPAGTYRISMSEDSYYYGMGYILSAPSDNYDVVLSSVSVYEGEDASITVQDGQYVQLKGCYIAE